MESAMPEGDTIHRTAARLRSVLDGKTIQSATSPRQVLDVEPLAQRRVLATEARGKHLLIHLAEDQVIHSHLGMTGSWHVYQQGQAWRKPNRQAALVLDLGALVCVCFSPKTLQLLTERGVRRHPHLSRLGPDLLGAQFDLEAALARFRACHTLPVGEALMNQTIVCGVGNVYKSEVLFLRSLNPFARIEQLADDPIRQLISEARRLMQQNLAGYPRRTRFRHDGRRTWVYGRTGQPCFVCGTSIRMRRQGDLGRATFWCPNCQP
jgi:endonuclease-8